jgi:hypothetical protein
MKTGTELIANERYEQIVKHNRTPGYDRVHNSQFQLAVSAIAVLGQDINENMEVDNPEIDQFPPDWDKEVCLKMASKSYLQRLIIAGALLAAEIDRVSGAYVD